MNVLAAAAAQLECANNNRCICYNYKSKYAIKIPVKSVSERYEREKGKYMYAHQKCASIIDHMQIEMECPLVMHKTERDA